MAFNLADMFLDQRTAFRKVPSDKKTLGVTTIKLKFCVGATLAQCVYLLLRRVGEWEDSL